MQAKFEAVVGGKRWVTLEGIKAVGPHPYLFLRMNFDSPEEAQRWVLARGEEADFATYTVDGPGSVQIHEKLRSSRVQSL